MPAVIEFGFNAQPVFSGVDKLDARLNQLDRTTRQVGGGSSGRGMALGGLSLQLQDIAVQAQSGTKWLTIATQQGSQMASVFGPGGMVVGGLLAAGGLFLTMREKSDEAYAALIASNQQFDIELKKISEGSIPQMIAGMEAMKAKAAELQKQQDAGPGYFDPIRRFFSPTTFDASGKGTNQFDAMKAAEADALRKNKAGAVQLETAVAAEKAFSRTQAIIEAQTKLDQQKRAAALDEMDTAERLGALHADLNRLLEDEKMLRADFVPDELKLIENESRRITLQQQILALQKQLASEKEREATAAKQAAEQVKRQAEDAARANAQRKQAVMSAMDEYNLLKARSTRRKGDDYQVERDIAIRNRRDQLMKENGLSAAEATQVATEMRDFEERAQNGGRAPKIRGPKPPNGGKMGGLDQFHKNQDETWWQLTPLGPRNTPFPWEKDLIPGTRAPSMAGRHAANAAESKPATMDDYLQKILTILPKGIADALLGGGR